MIGQQGTTATRAPGRPNLLRAVKEACRQHRSSSLGAPLCVEEACLGSTDELADFVIERPAA